MKAGLDHAKNLNYPSWQTEFLTYLTRYKFPFEESRDKTDPYELWVVFSLKVHPGAKLQSLKVQDGHLVVHLQDKAIDGAANEGLQDFLSEVFSVSARDVLMISGLRSRQKKVKIHIRAKPEKIKREGCYFLKKLECFLMR